MAIRNIREYGDEVLTKTCKEVKEMTPRTKELNQWKFVPEKWTVPAAQRDSVYLFRSVQ